jgi:hypothetical protein
MVKRKSMWMMTVTIVVVPLAVAFADKLSDFKDADRYNEGCDTIPSTSSYSSDRSSFSSQQSSVKEWCG